MLHISPIYLESATAVYAEFFEDSLHRSQWGAMGHWLGRGVKPLGLRNPIELKALENLLNGLTPDGNRGLVPEAGDPKRIAGWQVVLKSPARLNNEWGVVTREAQIRIQRGFAQGVNRTLRCLEDVLTGVGTLAARADSPKVVTAVFRTNAAWDQTPALQATAIVMNMGLQSGDKALTFAPSQVMGVQRGLEDFFTRALHTCLQEQIGRMKSFASRRLGLSAMLDDIFDMAAMNARRRTTWARRDNRGAWQNQRSKLAVTWRDNADQLAFKSYWTRNMQILAKPGEMLADRIKELRKAKEAREIQVQPSSEAQVYPFKQSQARRQQTPTMRPKGHSYGHSY